MSIKTSLVLLLVLVAAVAHVSATTFNFAQVLAGHWDVVRVTGAGADAELERFEYELNASSGGELRGLMRDDSGSEQAVRVAPDGPRSGVVYQGAADAGTAQKLRQADEDEGVERGDEDELAPLLVYDFANHTDACFVSQGPWAAAAGSRYQLVVCAPTAFVLTVLPAAAGAPLVTYHWQKRVPAAPVGLLQRFGGPYLLMFGMIILSQWLKSRAASATANRQQQQQAGAPRAPAAKPAAAERRSD